MISLDRNREIWGKVQNSKFLKIYDKIFIFNYIQKHLLTKWSVLNIGLITLLENQYQNFFNLIVYLICIVVKFL